MIEVDDNFKVVLPSSLRKTLNIYPGDSVAFEQIGDKIYIKKSI